MIPGSCAINYKVMITVKSGAFRFYHFDSMNMKSPTAICLRTCSD